MPRGISKSIPVTESSTLPLQFCQPQQFNTTGDILGWLIDVRLRSIRPELSPRAYVASRLGISESELSLLISNQRLIKLNNFLSVASIAKAPEAFQFLNTLVFGNDDARPIPVRGSVRS